jgi:hypothetical protein
VRRDAATRVFASALRAPETRLVPKAGYALELPLILPLNGVGVFGRSATAPLPWGP